MRQLNPATCTPYERDTLFYCGLDNMVTREIHPLLEAELRPETARVYRANLALHAPGMAVGLRGTRVDLPAREHAFHFLTYLMGRRAGLFQARVQAALGWQPAFSNKDFGSSALRTIFYGEPTPPICPKCNGSLQEQIGFYKGTARAGQPKYRKCKEKHLKPGFGLKPYLKRDPKTGEEKQTLDANAVEKLVKREGEASVPGKIARTLMAFRAIRDTRKSLLAPLYNGRFTFELSFAATSTFRAASKADPMKFGGNSQNQHKSSLHIYIPDNGYYFLGYDLKSAESHILAVISNDPNYIEAHEGLLDCHTYVCKLIWPSLPWPSEPKADRAFAESTSFTKTFGIKAKLAEDNLRFMGKKLNHAAGRDGTYHTVARNARIPLKQAKYVLEDLFWGQAFPVCRTWMDEGKISFKNKPVVVIPGLDLRRQFFDRSWTDETYRDTLAFRLQAPCAWAAHVGFWRIWRDLDSKSLQPGVGDYQLMMHRHDQVVTQVNLAVPEAQAKAEIESRALVALPLGTRTLTIPIDVKTGINLKQVK